MAQKKPPKTSTGIVLLLVGTFILMLGVFMIQATVPPQIFNDIKLSNKHKETKGRLVEISGTGTYDDNQNEIVEFVYDYPTEENEIITSFSYSTGTYNSKPGDSIIVEYHPEIKYLSRIKGKRTTKKGLAALVSLTFPATGLVLIIGGIVTIKKSRQA